MNSIILIPLIGATLCVIAAVYSFVRVVYLAGKRAGYVPKENKSRNQNEEINFKRENNQEISELEAQLQQAQKMEAVGKLAGGIAHDFNNILASITGNIQILLLNKTPSDPDYEAMTAIDKSARRAGDLVRQILTFSRRVNSNLVPLDVNEEIIQTSEILKHTMPKNIDIELHLAEGLNNINADAGQIQQILMNLAVNSKDALPEGGKIIFRTKNVTLNKKFCESHFGCNPGKNVIIEVSDDGHGMDKKIVSHIFEPFFTTKSKGRGTGLGLATTYGIVKNHQGFITCDSKPGKGTTFKIYFPAIEGRVVPAAEPEETTVQIRGSETILIVDDEPTLLGMGQNMLTKMGYTVLTAPTGEIALEVYRREKEKIDLIILDLIMPGIGGEKCLDNIFEINSRAKVILFSGYPNYPKKEALEAEVKAFVNKPFDWKKVLRVIRKTLDESE